jgi:corrinoid protein of di/trimethylamine methyltransferase
MKEHLADCRQAIIDGDAERSGELARLTLEKGMDVLEVVEKGFVEGIREVGRLWEDGELFLPELVIGADAMKTAMGVLRPALEGGEGGPDKLGHVVIGTIEGDIHDIGKTLVATMLSANGFEVTDLGADVPVAKFVETAADKGADWIAISALLTTTMPGQKKVIEQLEAKSLRGDVKVMVGGAPCSAEWAAEIGADGYAGDAVAAVALARGKAG